MASVAAHHAEWLSLMDVSGPFLSVPVLKDALPNGLDAHDPHVAAQTRAAIEQWADPDLGDPGSERAVDTHFAFVQFVMHEVLGFDDDVMVWDGEHAPGWAGVAAGCVMDGDDPVLPVAVFWPDTPVDEILSEFGIDSPRERMVHHLKEKGCRIGLVTDGERWTLVSHQDGENPGFATWWSSLWGEEKITLQAFRTLLHQDRFLTLGEDEVVGALLDRSAEDQREITTKLGNQTLEAVEILIRTIDRIDRERSGELLGQVEEEKGIAELYDAAVTVMMRLIFLFYAEENDLLPMSEPLYVERYAASSLRERLQSMADEHGEEVLESTHDGWPRLLSAWRAVYGGVEHGDMMLAPYGGSLFDPDRYPFLEGRVPGSSWFKDEADPLPIDNRTVLHLLNALQTLDESGQRRKLSFRALDVEQIGHVYEGMLDHTAARAVGFVLGLSGTGDKQPEVELAQLEAFDDKKALLAYLKESTGRTAATTSRWLSEAAGAVSAFGRSWATSFGDEEAADRASRFAKLVRPDSTGAPTVFEPGSVYVADSAHRGATGTHYTPRSLTEEVVKHALDPLLFSGPSDGLPEEEWRIKNPEQILDLKVCDPACGSGAFLVQACRYLADAVVEASRVHAQRVDRVSSEELLYARRLVAERCLHGVDINPMAVEMAKLSLWLVTLGKDLPFSFLDHAIRLGDSLVGHLSLAELEDFGADDGLFSTGERLGDLVATAQGLRSEIEGRLSRSITDVSANEQTLHNYEEVLGTLKDIGDALITSRLGVSAKTAKQRRQILADDVFGRPEEEVRNRCRLHTAAWKKVSNVTAGGRPFHWPIEFSFLADGAFDAIIGNPPFLGAKRIRAQMGSDYRDFLVSEVADGERGNADLVVYFLLRTSKLTTGTLALIATNTISQGDSADVGLVRLPDWKIYRAVSSTPWPGEASLEISKLWMARNWREDHAVLDERAVSGITPTLDEATRVRGRPRKLAAQAGSAYVGSVVNGTGFVLTEAEALRFANDSALAIFIAPYLNGRDLNSSPVQAASRSIINFGDLDQAAAAEVNELFEIVRERVKPHRDQVRRAQYRERWWQYAEPQKKLYSAIGGLDRVAVIAQTSSTAMPLVVPNGQVFDAKLIVFTTSEPWRWAVLTGEPHRRWAWRHGTTMKTDLSYGPSVIAETYVFPSPDGALLRRLEESWSSLDAHRRREMEERSLGATKLYQLVNDKTEDSSGIVELRNLHVRLNAEIFEAYGWSDLDLDFDFVRADRRTEFTLSEPVQTEVLDRLLQLNFEGFVDEVGRGMHDDVASAAIGSCDDGSVRLVVE